MAVVAKEIMNESVVSITPDTPLRKAAEILDGYSFSGLPVVDEEGVVIGILSEADIIHYTRQIIGQPLRDPHRVLSSDGDVLHVDVPHRGVEVLELVASTTVETLMTFDVIMAEEETPLFEVVRLMQEHNINRVPVVDSEKKLRGIITRADIIRAMVNKWGELNSE